MYFDAYYNDVQSGVHIVAYLSIRKLPLEIEVIIQREVQKQHITKTEVVIDALRQAFHLKKTPTKVLRNVRAFFGKMSPKDYEDFQKLTQSFSAIEDGLWKS